MPILGWRKKQKMCICGINQVKKKRFIYCSRSCFLKYRKTNFGKKWKIEDTSNMKGKHNSILTEFKKGFVPWNKGIKLDRKVYPKMGHFKKHNKITKYKIKISKLKNPTKYWKNKSFSKEHKRKLSLAKIGKIPTYFSHYSPYGNVKSGWFDINGKRMFFRSKWEVNYALYLDWLKNNNEIKNWTYEEDVFIFEKIKFGTRSYRPDFKIYNNNGTIEYHEIKGWMDKRSKTKLKRMRIYYPNIKLLLVDKCIYMDIYRKVGKICEFI